MLNYLSNPVFAWPLVIVATIVEIVWFYVMKKSGGLEVWPYNLLSYAIVLVDVLFLSIALKTLPVGTVYAFWTGASLLVITLMGIYMFGDSAAPLRLLFIFLIGIGIVGLQVTS